MAKPEKFLLKNNLRVIVANMPAVKSTTIMMLVRAGSRYETKSLNGIAHFSEHMFFKGTKKRPSALEISSLIDGVGAEFNAFTSKEYTGFYIKSASNHLEFATEILSDMLLNSVFKQEEIKRERGVISEELRMYLDQPMRYVSEIFEELLYGDQPLGWDTVGTLESLPNINQKEFLDYRNKYYLGPNMLFVISGDVTKEKAKNLSEEYFSSLPNKEPFGFAQVKFKQDKPAIKLFYKDSEQAHFCLGVRAFPYNHPDRYKAAVLNTILGSSMSSRLFIQLRERRGLAYYVRSGQEEYTDAGSMIAQAGVEPKNINEAIKVVLGELGKSGSQLVGEEELKKAKEYIKGKLILEIEDSREVASMYGLQELLEKKVRTPEEIIKHIDQVSAREVQAIAKKIFVNHGLNLAVVGPFKDESKFINDLKF